jgi:hypothetical protein
MTTRVVKGNGHRRIVPAAFLALIGIAVLAATTACRVPLTTTWMMVGPSAEAAVRRRSVVPVADLVRAAPARVLVRPACAAEVEVLAMRLAQAPVTSGQLWQR